jgi:hypothetical protein
MEVVVGKSYVTPVIVISYGKRRCTPRSSCPCRLTLPQIYRAGTTKHLDSSQGGSSLEHMVSR